MGVTFSGRFQVCYTLGRHSRGPSVIPPPNPLVQGKGCFPPSISFQYEGCFWRRRKSIVVVGGSAACSTSVEQLLHLFQQLVQVYGLPRNPWTPSSSSICLMVAVSAVVRFSSNGSAGGKLHRDTRVSPARPRAARPCTALKNAHHKPVSRFIISANPDIVIAVEFELVAAVTLGVIHCSI